MSDDPGPSPSSPRGDTPSPLSRLWRALIGAPRDLGDRSLLHRISLIPILAWVGLGADGLSSSSYGPAEALLALGERPHLAIVLAAMTGLTVLIIASAYSRIIEEFPHGGGGYVVATRLLGERAGVVSGSALLVDYVLTITVSMAAAGDALFSFLPLPYHVWKLPVEVLAITGLTTLNIRGVRESVLALAPIFVLFVVTHIALIAGGVLGRASDVPATAVSVGRNLGQDLAALGLVGLGRVLLHAYALGGGTYTGIEAVSNGLPIMREPRVRTGKRTMLYMAVSLSFTAAGLLVCYVLWNVTHVEGKTLNAVLASRTFGNIPFGAALALLTLLSEGALLVVGAQAGFLDGPRVLANMAVDSWVPHRLSALSDRLTTQNGIVLMGTASLAALLYARGSVHHLVVMYSINVFLTFSLSMLGMAGFWFRARGKKRHARRRTALFSVGFLLCITVLAITVLTKFRQGGWITLLVTSFLVALCFLIRRHYRRVGAALSALYSQLESLPPAPTVPARDVDPSQPTAAVLVASYSGLGIHTALSALRTFPSYFRNVVFLSVGVVDAGAFKGEDAVEGVREHTEGFLRRYVELSRSLNMPATYRIAIGTDAVEEAERLCLSVAREFPHTTFFAGKIIFQRDRWYQRLLHNETAFAIQKRLQWAGQTMVILPAKVNL